MELGNQQVSDFERGWLCGVLDGEGTISMFYRQPTRKQPWGKIVPYVSIRNSNRALLEKVHAILRRAKTVSGGHILWRGLSQEGIGKRPMGQLQLAGFKRVKRLLDWMGDDLVGKHKQALLVREYIRYRESLPGRPRDNPYGEIEHRLLDEVRACQEKGYKGAHPRDYT